MPGPTEMVDHFSVDHGWRPGRRFLSLYLTFADAPEVAELAAHYQRDLDLPMLDPVPAEWLHLTVQSIGFTDELPPGVADLVAAAARSACSRISPFTMTLRPATLADQGVVFLAGPRGPLTEVQQAIQGAAIDVLGADRAPEVGKRFVPHVSVAYCNAGGDAAPLRARLAAIEPQSASTLVREVALLEVSRDTHVYQWRNIAKLRFTAPERQSAG